MTMSTVNSCYGETSWIWSIRLTAMKCYLSFMKIQLPNSVEITTINIDSTWPKIFF